MVGLNEPDDGAVFRLDSERAIISTTDFFPPVVDEPYDFGAIAAANALSDVYAMGGEPLFAINLVAWPEDLDPGILSEVLRGGAEKVREAGAVVAGGHTITDKEPKYGLAVTGMVHPDKIFKKGGALAEDKLVLTKPLGSGVITTALKNERANESDVEKCVESMKRLNRIALRIAQEFGDHIHAVTDITGFGLAGHVHELAHLSECAVEIYWERLPWMEGALSYGEAGIFPGGAERNFNHFDQWNSYPNDWPEWKKSMLMDPQTSGGLLLAIEGEMAGKFVEELRSRGESAWEIGAVRRGQSGRINFM